MDFAGVSVGGTPLLSGSEDTVLYDENVNPFQPKSVLPRESLSSLEKPDSNDNVVVYSEGLSGDGDCVASTGCNTKAQEVKQLRPSRRSFTIRRSTVPEAPESASESASEDQKSAGWKTRELQDKRRNYTLLKDTEGALSSTSEANSEEGGVHTRRTCNEPEYQPNPNYNVSVRAPPVKEAWEPSLDSCGELCVKSEDLPRDSEAGPEVAQFSEEEFRSAFEHFRDPSAFDFLQKFGDSKQLGRSSLGRCSLFLKFDPLLADGRPSLAPAKEAKKEKSSLATQLSDIPCEKFDSDELIDWSSSPNVAKQEHPRDLLNTSDPAKSLQAKNQDEMFSEKEMSQALKFQELMFQERLLKKDQEQAEELKKMQHRFQVQDNALRNMFTAIKDITRACESAGKEKQQLSNELSKVSKERDQLVEDLRGVETAFSDFHRRYEQAKDIIRSLKENETLLRNQVVECQSMLEKKSQMLSALKSKAEESIVTANKEIESSRKTMDAENTVLKGQLRKAEMKIKSLEKHLEQKAEENSQLTQMYDDLLSKVQQN